MSFLGLQHPISCELILIYFSCHSALHTTSADKEPQVVSLLWVSVRVSSSRTPAQVQIDSDQRDLKEYLDSYLLSDYLGPVLGASWHTRLRLSQTWTTSGVPGKKCLRLPPSLLIFYIVFLLYDMLCLTFLDHI